MSRLEQDRAFWMCAASFPPDKTLIYPGHAQAQRLDHVAGKHMLEYGCGGGADAMSFLRAGARSVTLCDIVPHNLATAEGRIRATFGDADVARCRFHLLRDSTDLPPGPFDVIDAHGVLHHIEEPVMGEVLAAMRRVIAPDGWLTVMLYSEHLRARGASVVDPVVAAGGDERLAFGAMTDGGGCIARWYTEETGKTVIEAAGFTVVGTVMTNSNDFRTFHARPA